MLKTSRIKQLLTGVALCAASAVSFNAAAQTNVSVTVGQPGFYGRIDLGDYAPRPVLYAPQPVIIERGPTYVEEPIYLRVPPGHRQHWSRFCGRYHACGRPVYFVRDDWYANAYVPAYREHFGGPRVVYRDRPRVVERVEYRDRGPERGWDHGPDHGRHEGWDRGRGHEERHEDHGHGEGHGHGHGHDRD